jgi:shikimate dehydrogenase
LTILLNLAAPTKKGSMTSTDRPLLCGLIGAGIQRSLSPALQQDEARHHGIRLHYQLIDLDASSRGAEALPMLIEAARIMRFAGLNITYPCKQLVLPLLDAVSDEARAIGAVNTVVRADDRLVGYNTDGSGWSWGFRRALPGADLACVVLLGAGGAGSACADAVLRLGATRLVVFDRDAPRAVALAARLNEHFAGGRASAGTDLRAALEAASGLIHATPTGMAAMPGMPLAEEWLRPAMWVSDVVYVPLETPLLQAARRIGCATADGGHMNVGQAIGGFKLFTGVDADAARMDAHFRRLVA